MRASELNLSGLRVAVIQDWLDVFGGGERVLEQILHCLPGADIFTLVDFMDENTRGFLGDRRITTSFIQRLPGARRHFRAYLPLMPLAIEQFDLSSYDLVVSNSHAVAKGVITHPEQLHISYMHSPMRYAGDMKFQYLREAGLDRGLRSWLTKWMLHRMRQWEINSTNGVDYLLTNSHFVRQRIRKTYRRDSTVLYPPVQVNRFSALPMKQGHYVTVSRMVPYKRIEMIAEAFSRMPGRELVIIGDGPQMRRVRDKAGPNVSVLGHQSRYVMQHYLETARGFVFAAVEDFGIAPVEAQACGVPVIAYDRGGVRETVNDGETGVFYRQQTPDSLIEAIERFERIESGFDYQAIRRHAQQFATKRFREEFMSCVSQALALWHANASPERHAQPALDASYAA